LNGQPQVLAEEIHPQVYPGVKRLLLRGETLNDGDENPRLS